jgi:hypothetical protein
MPSQQDNQISDNQILASAVRLLYTKILPVPPGVAGTKVTKIVIMIKLFYKFVSV